MTQLKTVASVAPGALAKKQEKRNATLADALGHMTEAETGGAVARVNTPPGEPPANLAAQPALSRSRRASTEASSKGTIDLQRASQAAAGPQGAAAAPTAGGHDGGRSHPVESSPSPQAAAAAPGSGARESAAAAAKRKKKPRRLIGGGGGLLRVAPSWDLVHTNFMRVLDSEQRALLVGKSSSLILVILT